MSHSRHASRRKFLKHSTGALGGAMLAPYFFTAARGGAAQDAPSDRVVIGSIGLGGQGTSDMRAAMKFGVVAAVCDVDAERAKRARKTAGGKADVYGDYRRVLERNDIQVVTIATPD